MAVDDRALETRIFVLAPWGRDAALGAGALEQAGMTTLICPEGDVLADEIARGGGAAIVAEEALTRPLVERLVAVLAAQLPWSDFPFLIFTARTASVRDRRRSLDDLADLGNVTALERPLHPLTMISAARSALRARARQYSARDAFEEREREVRQRDQFLAMLGHELRNPLGAIQNAARLAQHQGQALLQLERPLAIIDRQIRHLTQLVDDLLDVARVTSGKIALKRTPTDLAALCRGLFDEFRRASPDRPLELALVAPARPVVVLADRVRLEQIINNLLTNAVKYTPPGGQVTVSVGIDDAGTEAVLRVVDTGVGISAEILPTIFEPFTQSERTLDRSQGGIGLGLNVVRALVQLHGGAVTARSAGLGRGAEFVVRLPLANQVAADPEDVTPLSVGGLRRLVLIVEDGADNRESLRDLLESLGHTVRTAADGAEGVEQALALRPEVALVDIGLPSLDGFEVARRVRASLGSEVFLIALTGYGQPEDRARSLAAGFDIHLTKPVDLPALEDLLMTLRRSAAEPARPASSTG